MNKYKWILFDADNTLFDFTYSQRKALEAIMKKEGFKFDDKIFNTFQRINTEIWTDYDDNKITHEEIKTLRFRRFFDALGLEIPDLIETNKLFIAKLIENSKLFDGVADILMQLYGKVKMAIITNGMKEVQRPRFEQCKYKNYFDAIFISGELGLSKPNYEYFAYVHKNTGSQDKKDYLVVGDNVIADIMGAKRYGFDTCWYNPSGIEAQEAAFADYIIDDLEAIKQII